MKANSHQRIQHLRTSRERQDYPHILGERFRACLAICASGNAAASGFVVAGSQPAEIRSDRRRRTLELNVEHGDAFTSGIAAALIPDGFESGLELFPASLRTTTGVRQQEVIQQLSAMHVTFTPPRHELLPDKIYAGSMGKDTRKPS